MWSAQPVSSANAIARLIASSSAISGRESMKSRAVGPLAWAVSASFSAWTATRRPSLAQIAMPS